MARRSSNTYVSKLISFRFLGLAVVFCGSVLLLLRMIDTIKSSRRTYNTPLGLVDSKTIEDWFKSYSTKDIKGITANFTAVKKFGLGNKLFELISVLGIATKLNRTPFFLNHDTFLPLVMFNLSITYPALMRNYRVMQLAETATIYPLNKYLCCVYDDVEVLRETVKAEKVVHLDGIFFQSYKYFNDIKDEVRRILTPADRVREKVHQYVPEGIEKQFVICIHVRRGDFSKDNVHLPSNSYFTLEATRYLYKKYQKTNPETVLFVLGNDYHWTKHLYTGQDIGNLSLVHSTSPEEDLYFSSQYCNVVLITAPSSTFGFWLGYLSKNGSTVYYHDIRESNEGLLSKLNPEDFYPEEWVKLRIGGDLIEIH